MLVDEFQLFLSKAMSCRTVKCSNKCLLRVRLNRWKIGAMFKDRYSTAYAFDQAFGRDASYARNVAQSNQCC